MKSISSFDWQLELFWGLNRSRLKLSCEGLALDRLCRQNRAPITWNSAVRHARTLRLLVSRRYMFSPLACRCGLRLSVFSNGALSRSNTHGVFSKGGSNVKVEL